MSDRQLSLALYNYLCHHIVGTEEVVRTRRMVIAEIDRMFSNESVAVITSGSIGEGLDMKGSDFDVMFVDKFHTVQEYTSCTDFSTPYFSAEFSDTRPGFAHIRSLNMTYNSSKQGQKLCIKYNDAFYLSSQRFKSCAADQKRHVGVDVIHGPCVSDKYGEYDFAFCLHCPLWISRAKQWLTRKHMSWPDSYRKSKIVEHGILFVPIGSNEDDLEWRISFSVSEKLLIYSFNHTQLLCYALMKILLKDVISKDKRIENVLCSYFLKTIIFWLSEELPLSNWRPDNIINCFMSCFERLIYYVQYSVCPNYFMPDNNMFENKVVGIHGQILLEKLKVLYQKGWYCLLLSPQFSDFHDNFIYRQLVSERIDPKPLAIDNILMLLKTLWKMKTYKGELQQMERGISLLLSSASSERKLLHLFCLSSYVINSPNIKVELAIRNKEHYRQCKNCLSYLMFGLHHDAASGWLYIASFFYLRGQYNESLRITKFALSKCTLDKFVAFMRGYTMYAEDHCHLVSTMRFENIHLLHILKFVSLDVLRFSASSYLKPKELGLKLDCVLYFVPPVVFAHFLCFLCYFHLNDRRKCRDALHDLHVTVHEKYQIPENKDVLAMSNYCLGVAYRLFGEHNNVKLVFSAIFDPEGALF